MISKKSLSDYSLLILLLLIFIFFNSINFFLFHISAEFFSICIAIGIFFVTWNTRSYSGPQYLVLIGIAYFFVGLTDFFHTLSYKGMPVFPDYGANLPTQLWIIGRYIEAISLSIIPFIFSKKIKYPVIFIIYTIITLLAILSAFYNIFPDCFIEGQGLTQFKIISEYIIIGLLFITILSFYRSRQYFLKSTFNLIIASLVFTIFSEFSFTFYISVYGISNIVGHFLKILSFLFLYQAMIKESLTKPLSLYFSELTNSKEALEKSLKEKGKLMEELNHRVKNNIGMISSLIELEESKTNVDLDDIKRQLSAIQLIHKKLQISDDINRLNVRDYLQELLDITFHSGDEVSVTNHVDDITISTNQAIPIGIIANEIATNAIKYGFHSGEENRFIIEMKTDSTNNQYILKLSNTGNPFPEEIDLENSDTLGLSLITALVEQLDGTIELQKTPYPVFTIGFPIEED